MNQQFKSLLRNIPVVLNWRGDSVGDVAFCASRQRGAAIAGLIVSKYKEKIKFH